MPRDLLTHRQEVPTAMAPVTVERPAGTPASADEDRWAAFAGRDASADGRFVAGVTSTMIYCKPSCPARKPLRKNVVFYDTPAEAEAAGFRACKRCRPEIAAQDQLVIEAVTATARMIERAVAAGEPLPSLDALAAKAGYSRYHFHRMFKQALGVTPKAYGARLRSERLRGLLASEESVTQAIHGAAFGSSSRFYDTATARLGMHPTAQRRGGVDETIAYTLADCALGRLLVAITAKGVCSILIGAEDAALAAELARRFPHARLIAEGRPGGAEGTATGGAPGGDREGAPAPAIGLGAAVAHVVGLIEQAPPATPLPLDIRGTAFQERVWQALQAIPHGQTVTYTELARSIGEPRAVRAVANACGANPTAIAIPCHRVLRADGSLGGYRWGLDRKKILLDRERRG